MKSINFLLILLSNMIIYSSNFIVVQFQVLQYIYYYYLFDSWIIQKYVFKFPNVLGILSLFFYLNLSCYVQMMWSVGNSWNLLRLVLLLGTQFIIINVSYVLYKNVCPLIIEHRNLCVSWQLSYSNYIYLNWLLLLWSINSF